MLDIGNMGRIRNGQLNDVPIDQYFRLMYSSVPQYSAEFIPIIYTRHIFRPSGGQHVDDTHHKLLQYNLTDFKLLYCPIITNNPFTLLLFAQHEIYYLGNKFIYGMDPDIGVAMIMMCNY